MPTEFDLKLTADDMKILSDALQEMPFKMVVALINKINSQVQPQLPK